MTQHSRPNLARAVLVAGTHQPKDKRKLGLPLRSFPACMGSPSALRALDSNRMLHQHNEAAPSTNLVAFLLVHIAG